MKKIILLVCCLIGAMLVGCAITGCEKEPTAPPKVQTKPAKPAKPAPETMEAAPLESAPAESPAEAPATMPATS